MFPTWLHDDGLTAGMAGEPQRRPNLSPAAQRYLDRLGTTVEDLFHHVLASAARPHLPRGQRRGAAHGVAAHPPSELARRRYPQSGGRARGGGGARP